MQKIPITNRHINLSSIKYKLLTELPHPFYTPYWRAKFNYEIRKAGYPEGAEGEAKVNEIQDKIWKERWAIYYKMEAEDLEIREREYLEFNMNMEYVEW